MPKGNVLFVPPVLSPYLSPPATGTPGYPRPGLMPGREPPLGLHHPDLLGRPYADQLAHQV